MPVLVDTSVWIDFLRSGDERLSSLLESNQVCMHSMVIGELACGHLQNREQLLALWHNLPALKEASYPEVLYFLESNKLMGRGIGYVDVHLLAACALSPGAEIWTRDKRLGKVAHDLNLSFQ